MASTITTKSTAHIEVIRGDTVPVRVTMTDESTGNRVDLTGASGKLAVNPSDSPEDTSGQLFEVTGVIEAPATDGIMSFTLSAANADQSPGVYYYDIQVTLGSGTVITPVGGKWTVVADIADAGV